MNERPQPPHIYETERLAIACEVSGPAEGAPMILLHGWPDDARTWDRVLPALHAAGQRTYGPYLLAIDPTIAVPTLVIHGGGDPCNDPATSEGKERFFAGAYERLVLDGVGHSPQREAADAVARAITRFIGRTA